MADCRMSNSSISPEKLFDVREIPCTVKHKQIIDRWLGLPVGDHFVIRNDHDPVPLRYQFEAEYPGAFTWEHLQKGPEVFEVKISKIRATIPPEKIFDVREIPGAVKHKQIFERWLGLAVGDYFVLKNDHDPVPLRYQFQAEFAGAFNWEYLTKGPQIFEVKISKLRAVSAPAPASCGH